MANFKSSKIYNILILVHNLDHCISTVGTKKHNDNVYCKNTIHLNLERDEMPQYKPTVVHHTFQFLSSFRTKLTDY